MTEEKQYAKVAVNIYIFNGDKLLLVKSPKQNNQFVGVGGKVEENETLNEAVKREIKEEVGIKISNLKFLGVSELENHIIMLNYRADTDEKEIKLSDEHKSFSWKKPEEWLNQEEVHKNVKVNIEKFILNQENFEDKYLRALADYQNLLKQTVKEKMEFVVFANEQMLKEILPVYDHLKMALEHHNGESSDDWLKGVRHVVKQFKGVLEKIGVAEIKVVGEKFDHNVMEAVSSEEIEDESLDGLVAKQVKAGYLLNGKVIEAAKVVVYKVKS